jgi:hypothetical protein
MKKKSKTSSIIDLVAKKQNPETESSPLYIFNLFFKQSEKKNPINLLRPKNVNKTKIVNKNTIKQ